MPFSAADPGFEAMQERLAELIAPFASEFASRECAHGDWIECEEDDCTYSDSRPKQGSMPIIQDFVLVVVTADMADPSGEQEIHAIARNGQRNHITKGLLHVALNE